MCTACDALDEEIRRTQKARREVRYWRKRALIAEKKLASRKEATR